MWSDAGEYRINPSGLTSENYNITFWSAKLTVERLDYDMSDVVFEDETFVYDGESHT